MTNTKANLMIDKWTTIVDKAVENGNVPNIKTAKSALAFFTAIRDESEASCQGVENDSDIDIM